MFMYAVRRIAFDALVFGYLIIVGILAFLRPSYDQMLDLKFNSLVALACVGVGGLVSYVLYVREIKTLGEVLFAPSHKRVPKGEPASWYRTFWGVQTLVTLVVTIILGGIQINISLQNLLDEDHIRSAGQLFSALSRPNWDLLPIAVLKIIETIFIAFMATLLAVPIAFVLSFVCAKNIMGQSPIGFAIYFLLRTLFNISRSIEPILWAIIFSVWVGFGPYAGMLALMIHSIASLTKQYSEMVESIDDGPIEGIRSSGAGAMQTIWFAVVPQVVLPYISFTIYRWDINVRMATIIGFVGGGGIGEVLLQQQGQSNWHEVGCIIVVIAFVVWSMDNLSAYVREAIK